MTTKILVLASNPQGTAQLRLNPEIREIEEAVERGRKREGFIVCSKVAVRVEDLQRTIRKEEARIIHFCGHGLGSQGLILEKTTGEQQLLDTKAIADLFKLFATQVECVVLNACYSQVQVEEIKQHINYVIGTKREIRDDAAIAFSKGFYEAISDGEKIERAYEFGCNRIQLEIYGSSENEKERKLVPVYSEAESKWVKIPQHEVIELLIKEPLNRIVESSPSLGADSEQIWQRQFNDRSPYKGLKRFNAKDKDLFFGRERLTNKLIEAINQSNLVMVLGASGSGKSSVVRAGVIPQIENSSEVSYQSFLFTPNRNPFVTLHRSLLTQEEEIFSEEEVEFVLKEQSDTFIKIASIFKSKQPKSRCLIFIDQFEELFTLCADQETRSNFIEGINSIAQDKEQTIKLIIAMRSDFLEEWEEYPKFARIAERKINLVANMEEAELRQAIAQPAAQQGVVFESGLLEEIIRDVQGQAGSLPLLQYTLNLLWQEDDLSDRTLNIATYQQLGGVRGALQKHVNKIYEELPSEQQLATKQILLKLVDVVAQENAEILRVAVSKRAYKAEFTEAQAETVNLLINKSLLVSDDIKREGQSTVEIAHEALLTSWAELKEWITDARNTISLNNRLAEDAARWQKLVEENSDKAHEELWSGSKLEKAIELRKNGTFKAVLGGLGDDSENFIDASVDWRDRAQAEKIRLQRRAIKWLSGGLATALVATGIAVFFAIQSQVKTKIAELESQAANVRVKLSLSNELENLIEAIQIVGKNQKFNNSWLSRSIMGFKPKTNLISEVYSSLNTAGESVRERQRFGHEAEVWSVGFSPDGKYIVSGSGDKTVRLWLGSNWQEWLAVGCARLRLHPVFASTETDREATDTCIEYGDWSKSEKAEFLVRQGLAIAKEKGDVKQAQENFKRAKKLDSGKVNLVELEAKAKQIAAEAAKEQEQK